MDFIGNDEYKRLKYGGKLYAVVLNDTKNLLVIEEGTMADSNGFYKCKWIIYEGTMVWGVVESSDYIIKFNPERKEIILDRENEKARRSV